ncbi:hypothetical protein Fcan01_13317 [Folsomia candida]|uniref:Uncharacterized protein n=1 Tax=Folsomia candida TaxID=158441 RepID=A0A226E3L0_FOLCA|nr:hypothetical protein Fcan01_13317 [Folsomia candida]
MYVKAVIATIAGHIVNIASVFIPNTYYLARTVVDSVWGTVTPEQIVHEIKNHEQQLKAYKDYDFNIENDSLFSLISFSEKWTKNFNNILLKLGNSSLSDMSISKLEIKHMHRELEQKITTELNDAAAADVIEVFQQILDAVDVIFDLLQQTNSYEQQQKSIDYYTRLIASTNTKGDNEELNLLAARVVTQLKYQVLFYLYKNGMREMYRNYFPFAEQLDKDLQLSPHEFPIINSENKTLQLVDNKYSSFFTEI